MYRNDIIHEHTDLPTCLPSPLKFALFNISMVDYSRSNELTKESQLTRFARSQRATTIPWNVKCKAT